MEPNPTTNSADTSVKAAETHTWSLALLEKMLFASIEEQRRARRWRIFLQLLTLSYLLLVLFLVLDIEMPKDFSISEGHTARIDIEGTISDGGDTDALRVNRALQAAFDDPATKGVVLYANSPGGSPVQSGMIYREILKLKQEHPETKVYAVISDLCASGCYYIAAAADKIYADPASLVGSIGVRFDSFGFVDLLEKIGVERRLVTAGENKGLLDPFLPVDPAQKAHVEKLLADIHQQFIKAVQDGRGERLVKDEKIFSGLIWTGDSAIALGLVDELADLQHVAEEVIGAKTIVRYGQKRPLDDVFASISQAFWRNMAKAFTFH